MKKFLLLFVAAVYWAPCFADTIAVRQFKYAGPFVMKEPVMIDSLNAAQKAFSVKSFLDAPLPLSTLSGAATVETLPCGSDSCALHLAGFTVENTSFAHIEVNVVGAADYRLYVDGTLQNGSLTLEPATHKLALEYMIDANCAAGPSVSVIADENARLRVGVSGKRLYTLNDVIEGTRMNNVMISPDGKYLITRYTDDKEGGQYDRFCRVTEIETGKTVAESREPILWMPKTTAYYFTRDGQNGRQLVAVSPSTGAETVVADGIPDGQFDMSPLEDYLIYTLETDGPSERDDVYEVVHPDDRQPGWRSRTSLAKYDLSTGVMQPLTFGYRNVSLNDISSDGRYLLYSVETSRLTGRPTTLTSLYRLDLQTIHADELVRNDGFISRAVFSPDASKLLVAGSPESFGGVGKNVDADQTPSMYDYQLYVVDIASKSVTPLTKNFNPSVNEFLWSNADGNIYFTAEDRDCIHLFRMSPSDYSVSLVDVGEDLVGSLSFALSAQVSAFICESATNFQRLYTMNTKTGETLLVRDLHAERMSDIEFGECRAWDFVNSRGDTISGRYYLPPHFDASKVYPMIVNYYGGCLPTSRDFDGPYPHHAYAALGYVVYIVEPSGATGFGQKFSARHVNTAGDYVADDIIEGTKEFCREHPFVDSTKIGCIGASYGGFMTQYLQTKTDIFAAAISHAGISDHTSYWGEGYWGYSYSEVSMADSYPWADKQLYVDHSPLYNADKIHTPILFLHGTSDHNVPVGESIQMFTALKLLGRETALVLVEGQGHHILDYAKRVRWQATIFAWFAKWLQDDPAWWDSMYPKKEL